LHRLTFNSYGQLGLGNASATTVTMPLPINFTKPVISIAAGYRHNLAIASDNTLYAVSFHMSFNKSLVGYAARV
jgi:alpha-tubulin suppressor-like RCC1 family protein